MEDTRNQLKTLKRQYELYSKNKTAFKNNLIALIDQVYPNANTFFSSPARKDGSQKWVDFVTHFSHVDCVRGLSERVFTERYQKWCKRNSYNFNADKAAFIYNHSKEPVPTMLKSQSAKLLITSAVSQLNAISQTVEAIRAEMLRLAETLPEFPVVMDMYGVGASLGPQIMAEIGDVRRFDRKQSLSAFAGVDPMPSQSGTYERQSNPSSKRGTPYLRKSLFIVMKVLLQTAPEYDVVYQFLNKKRSEGKPYYVYMNAGCNKFLRVYYGRVKEYLDDLDT